LDAKNQWYTGVIYDAANEIILGAIPREEYAVAIHIKVSITTDVI
jgi:hypothetical protein